MLLGLARESGWEYTVTLVEHEQSRAHVMDLVLPCSHDEYQLAARFAMLRRRIRI